MSDGEYNDGVEAAHAAEGRHEDAAYDRQEAGIAASAERAIASFLNASRDAAANDIALKVAQVAGEEEAKAVVDHVREQRDLLAKAAQATVMFLRCGGLVTRTDVETWRALTGSSDFTLRGVEQFVREQMRLAGRSRLVTHGVPIQHDSTQRTYPCGLVEKRENYASGRHVHVSTRPDDAITCAACIAAGAVKP